MTYEEEYFNSNVSEVNDMRMEILAPDLVALAIPENKPDATAPVKLSVCITNNTSTPFRLNPYGLFIPELVTSNGQALKRQLATGEQLTSIPANITSNVGMWKRLANSLLSLLRNFGQSEAREIDPWSVEPEWPQVVSLTARLSWRGNSLQLKGSTILDVYQDPQNFNQYWLFDNLQPGNYQLRYIYNPKCGVKNHSDLNTRKQEKTLQQIGFEQLLTPLINLRLVQPIGVERSEVEVDGINFKTLMPECVLTGEQKKSDAETSVELGVCVTNNMSTPIRFSFYASFNPEMVTLDGQIVRGCYHRLGLMMAKESDFPLVMPRESITFFPEAKLFWLKRNVFTLSIAAGDGGFWNFEIPQPGVYKIRFTYSNKNAVTSVYSGGSIDKKLIEGLWTGMVSMPFVEFRLV